MYKKAICALMVGYLILIGSMILYSQQLPSSEGPEERKEEYHSYEIGIAKFTSSDRRIVYCQMVPQDFEREEEKKANQEDELLSCFPDEEIEILQRIVEAEAGGEDEDGKVLVANVVLNRVESEDFPDTIREVVFQRDNGVTQFSPVASGKYEKIVVSEETKKAVDRALGGEDLSQGALYFAARKHANKKSMRWFDTHLTFVLQHGGHEFFK